MAWTQSSRCEPRARERFGLFALEVLIILVAAALATLVMCAAETRFGFTPTDWDVIVAM